MKTVHNVASDLMATTRARDVWDEMPMLIVVAQDPDGDPNDPLVVAVVLPGGAHPNDVMNHIAQSARNAEVPADILPGAPLIGIALFAEGWAVVHESEEKVEATKRYIEQGGKIENLPERIEVKQVTSYDGERMSTLSWARGTDTVEELHEFDGSTPDAIRNLFEALREAAARG